MTKKRSNTGKKHKENKDKQQEIIYPYDNGIRSLVLFFFTFLAVFTLSIFSVPKIIPEPTYAEISVQPAVLPEIAIVPSYYLPYVPNEARYRVRPSKQATDVTEHVKKRICETFGSRCQEALVIALHESGYYLKATSSANAIGIMQIHCASHKAKVGGDCNKLYDLEINLKIAYDIYARQGWRPWEARYYLKDLGIPVN